MIYSGMLKPVMIFEAPIAGAPILNPLVRTLFKGNFTNGYVGNGFIEGTVSIDALPPYPVHRKVRVFDQSNGVLVDQVWSDEVTGEYRFENLATDKIYVVMAHDYTGTYNAEIIDNVVALPMTL